MDAWVSPSAYLPLHSPSPNRVDVPLMDRVRNSVPRPQLGGLSKDRDLLARKILRDQGVDRVLGYLSQGSLRLELGWRVDNPRGSLTTRSEETNPGDDAAPVP